MKSRIINKKSLLLQILILILIILIFLLTSNNTMQYEKINEENARNLSLLNRIGKGTINEIDISPNNQLLATSGSRGISVYEFNNLQPLYQLLTDNQEVFSLEWSPDGQKLAAGLYDQIQIWDLTNKQILLSLEGTQGRIKNIIWSPDNLTIAYGGQDGFINVVDANSGSKLASLEGHKRQVLDLSWSPDGKNIVGVFWDGVIIIWDAITFDKIVELNEIESKLNSVVWSPNGEMIAAGGDEGIILVWEYETGNLVQRINIQNKITDLVWSPIENELISAGYQLITILDMDNGKIINQLELRGDDDTNIIGKDMPDKISSVDISTDGGKMVYLSKGFYSHGVHLIDLRSGNLLNELENFGEYVSYASLSPKSDKLLTFDQLGNFILLDSSTGEKTKEFEIAFNETWSASWSKSGNLLAIGFRNGKIHIVNSMSGEELTVVGKSDGSLWSVDWCSDDERIIVGNTNGQAAIYDLPTGDKIALVGDEKDPLLDEQIQFYVTCKNDFPVILSAEGGIELSKDIWLWDEEGEQKLIQMDESASTFFNTIVLSMNGDYMAGYDFPNKILIWETKTGIIINHLDVKEIDVRTFGFSPEGDLLVVGGTNGKLWFFSTLSGNQLLTLAAHSKSIYHLSWSMDGRKISTLSEDGTIGIWGVKSE